MGIEKGVAVLKTVEGIYKDGEVELAEQARQRLLARMRTGIPLGGAPYPTREEIYGRGSGSECCSA